MSFNVPPNGLPANAKFRLQFLLLGRASGTLPDLQLSYRQLPLTSVGVAENLPTTDTTLSINTVYAIGTNQLVTVLSSPISINPSDTLFVTVTRVVDSSYPGEIGLVRVGGIISAT